MAFLYPYLIYSLIILTFLYICHKHKNWSSSMPTNWPLLGMIPSLLWNFGSTNEYVTDILRHNGGTFMFKGPGFCNTDMLITSDPANFHYISSTNFHNYPKGPHSREIFDVLGDGIFNCDSKLWELHRKTTISLFKNVGFLKVVEKTMWNNMEKKLMPVLDFKSKQGSKMDLQEIFQRLTFDSIISLLLAYDPETLSIDFPYNAFKNAFTKSEEALFNRYFLPKFFWKLLNRLHIGNEKYLSEASKLSDKLLYKFIKSNREKEATTTDNVEKEQVGDLCLLRGFMREYKDQTGSFGNPDKFIKDTLFSLMVAGRDTTSSTLTSFFYLLSENPLAEGKIREEIHEKLGMKEGEKWKYFGSEDLEKLVYLQGALYEALRLFPPLPANQKISLQTDTLPSGHQVHKNSKIILHPYAMGHMETIWGDDCLDFKPERWLSDKGGINYVPSYKFTAFHAGRRSCIGKEFSLIQMKMVAATMIYNYDIEVVEGYPRTQNASVFVQFKYGLMVKLNSRDEGNSN
ncbi:cytochrome P450 [Artemisia annua]|uniref:Cytochrome P450 n=1 Tax=Artemisia annua TaxID=35608 RepID=A0A2U1L8M9_ARTAN|nr:cytochrome P450 [Artemisia annua]